VFNEITKHYYSFPAANASFNDALRLASEATFAGVSGHVFVPGSVSEMNAILAAGSLELASVWMGLTDQAIEGSWVFAAGPHAGEDVTELLWWTRGEPNGGTSENCAKYSYEDILIVDDDCNKTYRYIIEFECPSGQQFNSAGTACVGMMP
jgi:hypothetical protein